MQGEIAWLLPRVRFIGSVGLLAEELTVLLFLLLYYD